MTKRQAEKAPTTLRAFVRIGRPWKSPPKGWQEAPGGLHHGSGVWSIRYERLATPVPDDTERSE